MYIFLLAAAIVLIALLLFATARNSRKRLSAEEAQAQLDAFFTKQLGTTRHQSSIQIAVDSDSFSYRFAKGRITADHDTPVAIDQPFHAASVGKVFTAVLIMKLSESGHLSLDDPIANYLPADMLHNLFTYKDVDYSSQVTIRHLMGHTSGVADYFEDAAVGSPKFTDRVIANRDEFWTPAALVDFSRRHQQAIAAPGTQFHYSDTGYILLGLIIESVSCSSFGENLHRHIFDPYGMDDSYLLFYTEPNRQPKKPIQDIWLNGAELSRARSLSGDWAGGGIVTTLEDLLRFQKALRSGACIRPSSLEELERFEHKFRTGIRYGLGMMEVRFEEFFFFLRGLPRLRGHIGILGTHMFSDSSGRIAIAMNFGSSSSLVASFRALFKVMNTLSRIRRS